MKRYHEENIGGADMSRKEFYIVSLAVLTLVFGLSAGILIGLNLNAVGGTCALLAILTLIGIGAVSDCA